MPSVHYLFVLFHIVAACLRYFFEVSGVASLFPCSEVFLFSKTNYKVVADIGDSTAYMWRRYVVLDSGAGPNCIAKSAIPPGSERHIAPPPRINVRGAGGDALGIYGQIHLALRLGDTLINVPFLVCDTLQAEALLGTEFIDAHVRNICCEDKLVELKTGTEVPILRTSRASPPDSAMPASSRSTKKNGHANEQ